MRLSYFARHTPEEGRAIILTALDAGTTLLDTADVYGPVGAPHENERLIRSALDEWPGDRDSVLVATKGGHIRTGDDTIVRDGRPEALRAACERSLEALGVERIGLYQYHGVDPAVPLVDAIGALAELQAEGKIGMIGLSNVGRKQIAAAAQEAVVASVQNRFSPLDVSSIGALELCRDAGIAFLCWSPLGGLAPSDLEAAAPVLGTVARRHGASSADVALAWELSLAPNVIPIPGATSAEQARANAAAATLLLDERDRAELAVLLG